MASYAYSAINAQGAVLDGVLSAPDPTTARDQLRAKGLLAQSGMTHDPGEFKRVPSAKSLYHWHADADQEY